MPDPLEARIYRLLVGYQRQRHVAAYGAEYADTAPLEQADRCAECREEHDGDGDCPACEREGEGSR